jgi:hypothetical protein
VVGLAIAAAGIWLLKTFPTHEALVQVGVWSLIVMVVVLGPNWRYVRKSWFWKAFAIAAGLHACFIASLKHTLPFSTLGVAILISLPEAILFLVIFGVLSDRSRSERGL